MLWVNIFEFVIFVMLLMWNWGMLVMLFYLMGVRSFFLKSVVNVWLLMGVIYIVMFVSMLVFRKFCCDRLWFFIGGNFLMWFGW